MREPRLMQTTLYTRYLLVLLVALSVFNFMDRWAFGLVLQNIKTDLRLTDTQLGCLTGIAFALFYSLMGIPIARWADRGNRVVIISLTGALGSVAVALCGTAGSFVQLMLIRMGVGIGEAGGFIPSFSLLADYFNRAERPKALAIYALGAPLSMIVGYSLAGWLNELYGWRVMFILLGLPGLVLALVASFTLREPRRKQPPGGPTSSGLQGAVTAALRPSLKDVWSALFSNATYRHLLIFTSILFFFAYGILQWQPTFFVRSFGFSSSQVGRWFAIAYGVGGLGTYLGGALASRYAPQDECLQLKAVSVLMIGSALLTAGIYLSPNHYVALGLMALGVVGLSAVNGPVYATLQTLVPEPMRAVSVAVMLLFANLIGMGLGPLAVGVLSDALRPWVGQESLRYSLLALAPGYVWAAWHAWRASKTVSRDLATSPTGVGAKRCAPCTEAS